MSADLHIHVFEGLTESDLRDFSCHTLGSKWFDLTRNGPWEKQSKIFDRVGAVPNIWIGSVSWLKASLLEDDSFVPNTVAQIYELIGEELPVLDKSLRDQILAAFDLENSTGYGLAEKEEVEAFLGTHMGKKLFTVSW